MATPIEEYASLDGGQSTWTASANTGVAAMAVVSSRRTVEPATVTVVTGAAEPSTNDRFATFEPMMLPTGSSTVPSPRGKA